MRGEMITLLFLHLFATTNMSNVWYQGTQGLDEMKGIIQESNMGGLIYLRDRSKESIDFEKKYLMDRDVKQFLEPFLKSVHQGAEAKKILQQYGLKKIPTILVIKGKGGLVGEIPTKGIMVSEFIYGIQKAMKRKVLILGSSSTQKHVHSGKGLILERRLRIKRARNRIYSPEKREKAARWNKQGDQALEGGSYDKAARFYRRALGYEGENRDSYEGLSRCYLMAGIEKQHLGYLTHAKHYSRQCNRFDPRYQKCHHLRGESEKGIARYYAFKGLKLLKKKQCRRGMTFFKKSIKIKPNADAYFGMGECYARDGQRLKKKRLLIRARDHFRKALIFNPKHADSQSGMIRLDQYFGDL